MPKYVRVCNLANTIADPWDCSTADSSKEENPWGQKHHADGLDSFGSVSSWELWFLAVDAANHEALKTKVPADFFDLIDGKEVCPDCGAPLGYLPRSDREHMIEICSACGHRWLCCTQEESERAENWDRWMREHGEPRSFIAFLAWQARQWRDEAERDGQGEGDREQ